MKHAYMIPTGVDATSLPFVFDGDHTLSVHWDNYVEVDGTIVGYDEVALRTPEAAPVLVPETISRFQALAAMTADGVLTNVQTAVAGADQFTQLAFNEAAEFKRSSPTVAAIAAVIGLSDAQLDDMFIRASVITA